MKLPTVYTGAFGYRDNDAIGHIASLDRDVCESALWQACEAEQVEAAYACDAEDHGIDAGACEACEVDAWYVGPFEEGILSVLHASRNWRFLLDDIKAGSVFLEAYE